MLYRFFNNDCTIQLLTETTIMIQLQGHDPLYFDETDKPRFDYEGGESVIEYTGLATDHNEVWSWAKATYRPESRSKLHYHREHTEDYYIISGCALVVVDGKKTFLNPGDHIRIHPLERHQVINASQHEKLTMIVKCEPAWTKNDYCIVEEEDKKDALVTKPLSPMI